MDENSNSWGGVTSWLLFLQLRGITKHEKKHLYVRCCYISALVLTCFRLTEGRAMHFRPETIVDKFLASYGVTFQSVTKSFFNSLTEYPMLIQMFTGSFSNLHHYSLPDSNSRNPASCHIIRRIQNSYIFLQTSQCKRSFCGFSYTIV